MSLVLDDGVFTTELVGGTLIIVENYGVRKISVSNASEVVGTVTGQQRLGALASSSINLQLNDTITIIATDGAVIKNLTIVSPADCLLKIVALV